MNESEKLLDEYFNWMYHLVCSDRLHSKITYYKLFQFLYSVPFLPDNQYDFNRKVDGEYFRLKFGSENGYSIEYIENTLDINMYPCSMLEMMVALANRIEEQLMSDNDYGDRTAQWFWEMMISLGLEHMDDYKFDEEYCKFVYEVFTNRNYQPNGKGGLFTLENPKEDLRNVEIWYQCMWYLREKDLKERGGKHEEWI